MKKTYQIEDNTPGDMANFYFQNLFAISGYHTICLNPKPHIQNMTQEELNAVITCKRPIRYTGWELVINHDDDQERSMVFEYEEFTGTGTEKRLTKKFVTLIELLDGALG